MTGKKVTIYFFHINYTPESLGVNTYFCFVFVFDVFFFFLYLFGCFFVLGFIFLSNNVGIHFPFMYYFPIRSVRLVPMFSGNTPLNCPEAIRSSFLS